MGKYSLEVVTNTAVTSGHLPAGRCGRYGRLRLLSAVVASVSILAGCSPDQGRTAGLGSGLADTATSSVSTGTDDTEPYQAPVMSAVSAALGADLEDIYRAVLVRRRTATEECITASGWSVSQAELDDLFDPGPNDGGTTTAYIDQLIAEFSQPEPSTKPTTSTDRQRVERIVSCMDAAEATYPNPNTIVLTAIEDFDKAVSARVAADRRVADARQGRDDCAAKLGVPARGTQDPLGVLSQKIADVQMAAFEGGSDARTTAIRDLRSLRETAVKVQACFQEYSRAIQPVVDEVQRAELAARPDLIPSIVQQTATLMEQYRALLPP